ncbi:hypothetical protein [Pseudoduganella violacea]|uniref:Uncharacterized protein n=1 Tax=Pseudoduganella violacea TaxID=1715466 RepID=A0A7W5BDJ5_9BURK|nr:hypothetical protein [Pseudoduganella violacea]MBB3121186.1 hypothetical protein [Pseudoduganella violacea]
MKTSLLLLACLAVPLFANAAPVIQPEMLTAAQVRRDGSHDEALRIVKQQFERIATGAKDTRQDYFITMFEWGLLVEEHVAARTAMISERDEQVRRLLEGDSIFCTDGFMPISRFHVIVDMNQFLQDSRATYRLVTQLLAHNPALVRHEIHRALPAIVEAGDYALAIQYIKNPLDSLLDLNRLARDLPIYPPHGNAPRLAAELTGFMGNVILRRKALTGLGRDAEAEQLRAAALKGIHSPELRALASGELAEPGSITRLVTEHQMRQRMAPLSTAEP